MQDPLGAGSPPEGASLGERRLGMQQGLIGQRDLWSLPVAIPTCLWFPASRGVKCRVGLVPRGGPGARGNPRLCQPGKRPSASAGELAGTAGLPGSPHHPDSAPHLSPQLRGTEGAGGGHGTGELARAPRSLSAVSFREPEPQEGHRRQPLCPAVPLNQSIPAQKLPLPAAGFRGRRLPRCRALSLPAPPGCTGRPCPRARSGQEGSVLPRASPAARRSRGAVWRPGRGAAGSLPSAGSWSHEPLPAALQEAAGPGDPLLLSVCHRHSLPSVTCTRPDLLHVPIPAAPAIRQSKLKKR
ncbi:Kv channel-interacting protein 2 isoform X1 [Pipra filicauda]|uniref:Kv channel-interacting protein 2 isoform X1 n=1 Tax=Pipra filicauda TaxID=649802 RepID=A0A7R5KKA9_9PASS|nr:Kv channel-interacting protein 2 isoform X1 [Pipra filicauda]